MATPTEQNPVTPTAAPGEVRVIVVKLPFDLQERILCFPLLHKIREKYPKAEIHFISPKKEIEVLNLLPFTAYYHEVEEAVKGKRFKTSISLVPKKKLKS